MTISKVIYIKDTPVFHVFLTRKKINSVLTTIPKELLYKHFFLELFHLENALVLNESIGNQLIDDFANKIIDNEKVHPFFYSDFLFKKSENKNEIAFKIIELDNTFILKREMFFSETSNPIRFFYLRQRFRMYFDYIMKAGKIVKFEELKKQYKIEYFEKHLHKSNIYLEINEPDIGFKIIIAIDRNKELKMLIS